CTSMTEIRLRDVVRQKNKLLHLWPTTPGALVEYDEEQKNDVFGILVEKLNAYFSPKRNSKGNYFGVLSQ
ncbi:hypothetical protein DOY81_007967, partial [Sarcophaga bullata]